MTTRTAETSPLIYARVSGFLYLIIFVGAIFSGMLTSRIVPGDATATVNNILASELLFRIGFIGWLVHSFCEIVLSVLLYVLLKPVSKTLALLMASLRLVHIAILGINLLNLFFALLLLSGADYLTVFETNQLHALVLLFLDAHKYGFAIGLTIFGFHVFFLGYLVLKSDYFPRILGVLLIIASFGYLIDSSATFLFPNYETYPVIMVPLFIAELSFALWLLFKGVNVEQWEKRALESA